MVAIKNPNKTPTPAKPKPAAALKSDPPKGPAKPSSRAQAAAKAAPSVSEAVEAPKPESIVEAAPAPAPAPIAVATPEPAPAPEPVVAATPETSLMPKLEPVPALELGPEEADEAELVISEELEQLASLAEQVYHDAEAVAGEVAHNFQVALKAATGEQGVVPVLSGMNTYLQRSVQINTQFMEQFAAVRSPVDLVNLQVRFFEEHGLALVEFSKAWSVKKTAA